MSIVFLILSCAGALWAEDRALRRVKKENKELKEIIKNLRKQQK